MFKTVITCFIQNEIGLSLLRVIEVIKLRKADFYGSPRLG